MLKILDLEQLNKFSVVLVEFWNFMVHNCIVNFDSVQVSLKLQVTNFKKREVTANPKPQILQKNPFK